MTRDLGAAFGGVSRATEALERARSTRSFERLVVYRVGVFRGKGTEEDPYRVAYDLFTVEGELLATLDAPGDGGWQAQIDERLMRSNGA